jgi:hypothetical protein
VKTDHLSDNSNRICKSNCLQYKATKPVNGGRYGNGQVRCQTCEIYMTENGASNGYCLCCNMRVRSKPRNSAYKEILRNNEANKPNNESENYHDTRESLIDIQEDPVEKILDTVPMNNDYSSEKKSTPIYDEIDESVKTFYEFKEFLENDLRPRSNYQFVMLHELLTYRKLHKGEIAESLAYFNNKDTTDIDEVRYYFDVPVYHVLVNHGFVKENDPLNSDVPLPHYSLNVKLEEMQRIQLLEYLLNELTKYNQEHDIPLENQFPESNNMENFYWPSDYRKFNIKQTTETTLESNIDNEINGELSEDDSSWKKISSVVKKILPDKSENNSIPTFAKTCPKCNVTQVTASLRQEFEEKIEESFGYRSPDPDNPDEKIPQSWCRQCRNLKTSSNIESEIDVTNDVEASNYVKEHGFSSDSIFSHICSDCKETKIEGIPGLELDKKIEEFFGTRPSYSVNSRESRKINPICRNCRRLKSHDYRTKIKNEMIDQELEESDSIYDIPDTKIFNFDCGKVNIQNCKILSTDTIKKDQILTNDEIMKLFKVGNMGGIRYTKYNNVIVLFSTHSDDYDDSIDLNSGFIIYSGEGKGDQEIKNGNEKILNSKNTPMVYFKEVYQEPGSRPRGALDNKYKFIGVVKYHKYHWANEKGRKVIKFVLEIVS